MKILLVSFYFPPDLSAGSFRTEALVEALQRRAQHHGITIEIEVLTTVPNRYSEIAEAAPSTEKRDGLTIHRITLPVHASGLKDQSRAFGTFARMALKHTGRRRFDLVFGTSSRLMTAALTAQIARRTRSPLYLDIRDLFTETMQNIFAHHPMRHGLNIFRLIERRTFRSANQISVNSPGFVAHVSGVAPKVGLKVFTNGIDPEFQTEDFAKLAGAQDTIPTLLYAGNLGEGQGLERIVPRLAERFAGRAKFCIIGSGGRRSALAESLRGLPEGTVTLCPAIPRRELYERYRAADALFVHLNDYPAFRKVIPSKLFEYGATGKPILAGLTGHSALFVETHLPGSFVFPPCDFDAASAAMEELLRNLRPVPRPEFIRQFDRVAIMNDMADNLISIASTDAHPFR